MVVHLKAEKEGKTPVDAMTAIEAAADKACRRRRPTPPSVPGVPCGILVHTSGGGASASPTCGGGATTATGYTADGRQAGSISLQGFARFQRPENEEEDALTRECQCSVQFGLVALNVSVST